MTADTVGSLVPCDGSQSAEPVGQFSRRLVPRDLNGTTLFQMAEPRVLPFRKLPCACLDSFDRFGERKAPFQMIDRFLIAERLSCGAAQRVWSRQETGDLVQ